MEETPMAQMYTSLYYAKIFIWFIEQKCLTPGIILKIPYEEAFKFLKGYSQYVFDNTSMLNVVNYLRFHPEIRKEYHIELWEDMLDFTSAKTAYFMIYKKEKEEK